MVKVDVTSPCHQTVRCRVFSVSFRKVLDTTMEVSGRVTYMWDLKDEKGRPVAAGMYYLVFDVDGKDAQTRRVVVLR